MASAQLNARQAHALLDILSHHEVYAEIADFRHPGTLSTYGPPFKLQAGETRTSPSLQALVSKFVLKLPGLRDVSSTFWQRDVQDIIDRFERADLSESYDKGIVGIRKTLATAASALIEYPVRGVYAGFEQPRPEDANREYDLNNASDLSQSFADFMHQIVYGDVLDQVFKKTAESDHLSDHSPLVQAGHEYILVNFASFLHYALVISPKGQNLLALIDSANKLVPWLIIKQTLRIGNVATMINGMMRVVLAKVSLTSVTNWFGLTQNEDDGMNLLEQIIYQVLNFEIRDFKSKASKIEKDSHGLQKQQLHELKAYATKSREEHEGLRQKSQWQSKSLVWVILDEASVSTNLTDAQHTRAQEYLTEQLSIRDREQIIKVLCYDRPDRLTQAIKDVVAAYDPVIRAVHSAVDLSGAVGDFENFIKDTIRLAKVPGKGLLSHLQPLHQHHHHHHHIDRAAHSDADSSAPTVGDFVQLLKKHQSSLHRFLHQCAKNGQADLVPWFFEYAKTAAAHFRRQGSAEPVDTFARGGAGSLTEPLTTLFKAQSETQQHTFLPILDAHADYLDDLHTSSAARLTSVLSSTPTAHAAKLNSTSSRPSSRAASPGPGSRSTTDSTANLTNSTPTDPASTHSYASPGPGAYLARWQALLDATAITPATASGPVRSGGHLISPDATGMSLEHAMTGESEPASAVSTIAPSLASTATTTASNTTGVMAAHPPDTREIVRALLPGYRTMLAEQAGGS